MTITLHAQFTVIPLNTQANIQGLAWDGDTIVICGNRFSQNPDISNYLAKSYDFGETITEIGSPLPIGYTNHSFQIVDGYYYMIANTQSYLYGDNFIMRSKDGGENWQAVATTELRNNVLLMVDTTFGLAAGHLTQTNQIFMTNGNDESWMLSGSNFTGSATGMVNYGDSTIMVITFNGVRLTHNRGQTWSTIGHTFGSNMKCQYFNQDSVYCTGHTNGYSSKMYYSYNGGLNWDWIWIENPTTSGTLYYGAIYNMYFDSPQHGYVVGSLHGKCVLAETNDFGQTWTAYVPPFEGGFRSILNINDSLAILGGENGLLVKWDKTIPITDFLFTEEFNNIENQILVCPNPVQDILSIEASKTINVYQITILNLEGKAVLEFQTPENLPILNLEHLQSGTYLIRFSTDKGVVFKKIYKV